MDEILTYIHQTYHPLALILYGSYADGSHNQNSDFDAMVITQAGSPEIHDTGFVAGIQLDLFSYPETCFCGEIDCEKFLAIYDGRILTDTEDMAKHAIEQVRKHIHETWRKSPEEIRSNVSWCRKMFLRSQRGDAEGMFRWHWVLVDSLEFICDILEHPYFGPKKSLRWLRENHPPVFEAYTRALGTMTEEALEHWVTVIEQTYQQRFP